jgi:GNAT superfamily N-acetyltransferase
MAPEPRTVLRAAQSADVGDIAEIWLAGWVDGHAGHVSAALSEHRGLADFRRRVPPRLANTTVAMIDVRIAGFVVVVGDEVEQLYVARSARGTGVAATLLDHAEHEVASRSRLAWLAVASGNGRARRFYEKRGWRDRGPFDYPAQITGGTTMVPCRRYAKDVA